MKLQTYLVTWLSSGRDEGMYALAIPGDQKSICLLPFHKDSLLDLEKNEYNLGYLLRESLKVTVIQPER